MLTGADTAMIRFAILRRLDKEPGVEVCEIKFATEPGFIAIGVLARLGQSIITRSRFDLPDPFELGHLHNEIDEIAEQYKEARRAVFVQGQPIQERELAGTGLRGRWAMYGLRDG